VLLIGLLVCVDARGAEVGSGRELDATKHDATLLFALQGGLMGVTGGTHFGFGGTFASMRYMYYGLDDSWDDPNRERIWYLALTSYLAGLSAVVEMATSLLTVASIVASTSERELWEKASAGALGAGGLSLLYASFAFASGLLADSLVDDFDRYSAAGRIFVTNRLYSLLCGGMALALAVVDFVAGDRLRRRGRQLQVRSAAGRRRDVRIALLATPGGFGAVIRF